MAYLTEPLFDITIHKMECSKGDYSSLYEISHVNGQFLATFKRVPRPKRGTEIYIRRIPVDLRLQEILEFALRAGDIYQIRLLMEFSGYNRGYCFVSYFDIESARKAAVTLNGEKIRGEPVIVKLSFDNNRLELQNIPEEVTSMELFEKVSKVIGHGLQNVLILSPSDVNCKTRKCLLRYDTHKSAVEARKQVYPTFRMFDQDIKVDWAIPTELVKAKRLYFENALPYVRKSQLYEEITKYVKPQNILNMFLMKGLGYILFANEKVAYDALTVLRDKKLSGTYLRFSFMKFYSHLKWEENNLKETEYVEEIGKADEELVADEQKSTIQEMSPPQKMFSLSRLANSLDDSGASSGSGSGSWSLSTVSGINTTVQTPPVPPCVQQPVVMAPTQPVLVPDTSAMPNSQYSMPDSFMQCPLPVSNTPIYTSSLVQPSRAFQFSTVPLSVVIPPPRPTQNAAEELYRLSGVPYPQQGDWILNRYQQVNQPIQILNLNPVVNNVPYDLTVLQMTEEHYREHFM